MNMIILVATLWSLAMAGAIAVLAYRAGRQRAEKRHEEFISEGFKILHRKATEGGMTYSAKGHVWTTNDVIDAFGTGRTS